MSKRYLVIGVLILALIGGGIWLLQEKESSYTNTNTNSVAPIFSCVDILPSTSEYQLVVEKYIENEDVLVLSCGYERAPFKNNPDNSSLAVEVIYGFSGNQTMAKKYAELKNSSSQSDRGYEIVSSVGFEAYRLAVPSVLTFLDSNKKYIVQVVPGGSTDVAKIIDAGLNNY